MSGPTWTAELETWTNNWIDSRFPGGSDAFRAVKDLVLKISEIHPTHGWQALRFVSKLQWLLCKVYPPDLLSEGRLLRPLSPAADAIPDQDLMQQLQRYWLFSLYVYPQSMLKSMNIACKETVEATILSEFPHVEIVFIQKTTEQGCPAYGLFVDHVDRELILAIRGSTEIADWVIDFVCHPNASGNHTGMEEASRLVDNKLRTQVATFMCTHQDYKLSLCGHSLGGGVASLLAIRWNDLEPLPLPSRAARAFAFGPPCVISREHAQLAKDYVTSVAFGRDFVTHFYHDAVHSCLLRLRLLAEIIAKENEDVLRRYQFDIDDDTLVGGSIDFTTGRRSVETFTSQDTEAVSKLVLPASFSYLNKIVTEECAKITQRQANGQARKQFAATKQTAGSFSDLINGLLTRFSPPEWAQNALSQATSKAMTSDYSPPTVASTPQHSFGTDEYWSACGDSPTSSCSTASARSSFSVDPNNKALESSKSALKRLTASLTASLAGSLTESLAGSLTAPVNAGRFCESTLDVRLRTLLEDTYENIMAYRCSEITFQAAGRYIVIVPRVHLDHYSVMNRPSSEDECLFNKCYFWEVLSQDRIIDHCREIPLSLESFSDHLCAKYAYALSPNTLTKEPKELIESS